MHQVLAVWDFIPENETCREDEWCNLDDKPLFIPCTCHSNLCLFHDTQLMIAHRQRSRNDPRIMIRELMSDELLFFFWVSDELLEVSSKKKKTL